jgi:hypothetical protein
LLRLKRDDGRPPKLECGAAAVEGVRCDHVFSRVREDIFLRLPGRLHRVDWIGLSWKRTRPGSKKAARSGVKIVVVALAIVLGFGFMIMPILVRPPQTAEQPPGSDPERPH